MSSLTPVHRARSQCGGSGRGLPSNVKARAVALLEACNWEEKDSFDAPTSTRFESQRRVAKQTLVEEMFAQLGDDVLFQYLPHVTSVGKIEGDHGIGIACVRAQRAPSGERGRSLIFKLNSGKPDRLKGYPRVWVRSATQSRPLPPSHPHAGKTFMVHFLMFMEQPGCIAVRTTNAIRKEWHALPDAHQPHLLQLGVCNRGGAPAPRPATGEEEPNAKRRRRRARCLLVPPTPDAGRGTPTANAAAAVVAAAPGAVAAACASRPKPGVCLRLPLPQPGRASAPDHGSATPVGVVIPQAVASPYREEGGFCFPPMCVSAAVGRELVRLPAAAPARDACSGSWPVSDGDDAPEGECAPGMPDWLPLLDATSERRAMCVQSPADPLVGPGE